MTLNNSIDRRRFLQYSSAALGGGVLSASASTHAIGKNTGERLPREVWIASISLGRLMNIRSQKNSKDKLIRRLIERMEETLPLQPDVICLTETFLNCPSPLSETAETVPGPVIDMFGEFARNNHCYIICPVYTKKDGRVYNTAVVIDRDGQVAGEYHKIHPTESETAKGVMPGDPPPPVFRTDFGTIGIQICFDANWHEDWRSLKQSGAEIVFFPSAFNAGKILNNLAFRNEYYIVSCVWQWHPSRIVDITGEDMDGSEGQRPWLCSPVNLEKKIFHLDFQKDKIGDIREKYGRQLDIRMQGAEGRFTIESRSPDITLDGIISEFELVTFGDYIIRATRDQADRRAGLK